MKLSKVVKPKTTHVLNASFRKNISETIHELTHKSHKLLNEDIVKKLLLGDSKDSNVNIDTVYRILLDYLKKPHSEIRLNAFFIFNIYFKNLPQFRQLAIDNLRPILELTTNLNYDVPLPPPKAIAVELNKFTLKCIKDWNQKFGASYKKLQLCYQLLLRKKNVDFEKLEMEDRATQLRRQEEEQKKNRIAEVKLKSLRNQINELKPEIENLEKSLESCLQLLIPTPEQFFISEDVEEVDAENQVDLFRASTSEIASQDEPNVELDVNAATYRETGMLKGSFSINIDLPKNEKLVTIIESEENAIVIENAEEHYKLLTKKYLDIVKNWIKNLIIFAANSQEFREIMNLKNRIETVMKKFDGLTFEKQSLPEKADSDSDSDYEELVTQVPSADEILIATLKNEESEKPSTSQSTSTSINYDTTDKLSDRKKKLLAVAPKLPYDIDLYHWEEEKLSTPMLLPVTAEGRQFWSASAMEDSEGIPVPDGVATLRTRTIEFTGKFEPVKWNCRFPLFNGKLCPRKDRYKCPFHGVIVARDESGKCVNLEDAKRDEELQSKISFSESQDPRLLAEIKSATGVDLKIHHLRKRKIDDGLMSIKAETNTVYHRLEKKIFKRSTIKKVSRILDRADQRKFRDKFGDQFQYVHETS